MFAAKKREATEKLLTVAVFMGIFFPVRLLFYTYVSQYWIGSFGLMTLILVTLFYLAHKNKLGKLGIIVTQHVRRFSKGRAGLGMMVTLCFTLYFFGNVIYGVEYAPSQIKAYYVEELRAQGVTDMESFQSRMPEAKLSPWLLLIGTLVLILPTEAGHSAYSVMNDLSGGWVLHFITVLFVEQLEILGLIVYFRFKKYPYSLNNSK